MRIIRVLAVFLLVIFLLFVGATAKAATYYVSAAGSDGAAGTSTGAPWLTVAKVNSTATTGDTIYFRRGDRWREQITVPGSTMTFGAYGTGAAPIIDGANTKTWTNTSGNIWTASVTDDPFFVMFNGTTGTKEANAGAVNAANEWFWTGGTLTVYNVGDPAAVVTVPTREYGIVSQVGGSPKNTITIRDIEFRGARYYNLKNSSGNTWNVSYSTFDHSGHGGVVFENTTGVTLLYNTVRYANQLGSSAFHEAITVTGVTTFSISRNTLTNNGEDGITAKYNSSAGTISFNTVRANGTGPGIYVDSAHDIVVSDNIVQDSAVSDKAGIGLAIEDGANPSEYDLTNITVTRNVVTNHAAGIWVWIEPGAESFANIDGIKIINNTLAGNNKTNWGGIFIFGAGGTTNYGTGLEIRNNIIWDNAQNGGAGEINDITSGGVLGDWTITHNLFKTGSPTDTTGTSAVTTAEVLFMGGSTYATQWLSPARNAGTAVSGIGQIVYESTPDIGAFEFDPSVNLRQGAGWCRVSGYGNDPSANITCQAAPGWTSGQLITTANLPNATQWSPINAGSFYVSPVSTTQFRLYLDSGLTIPAPDPGAYPIEDSQPRWAGASTSHTADFTRPRFQESVVTRGWRCATASKTNIPVEGPACLTSIVVAAGEATATIPGGHSFAVGGGVGTFEFAEATMNRTDRVVTAVTSTTVKWAEPTAPSGTYTDGQVSAYAHNLNPQWTSIKLGCTSFTTWDARLTDTVSEQAERPLNCAIVWYVSRDSTARTRARQIVLDPLPMVYGSVACDTRATIPVLGGNNSYCGRGAPGIDYGRGAAMNALRAYDILQTDDSMFTPTEEARFRDIILTDLRDNPSAIYTPTTFPAGTITVTGTNVTGVGTTFTSLSVGGVVWLKPSGFGGYLSDEQHAVIITSITDNFNMTIGSPKQSGTFVPATDINGDVGSSVWMYTRPWQSGDMGFWGFFQHHKNTLLGSVLLYPSHSGESDAVWQFNNLVITSQQFFVGSAIAFLGEDSRAKPRLTESWTMAADNTVAGAMSHLASGHPMGNNYIRGRGQYMYRTVTAMADVFPTYQNMRGPWLHGINWTDIYTYNGGDYGRVPPMQDQAYFGQTGEDAVYQGALAVQSGLDTLPALPVDLQRAFKNMLSVFSPTGAFADWGGGLRAFHGFEGLNPQLTPLPSMASMPIGLINDTTSRDLCAGWRWCRDANYVYLELVSRKAWNWDNTAVNVHIGAGTSDQDHLTPSWDAWWLNMGFVGGNQRCFMGTDDSDCALYLGYGDTGKKNGTLMARHSYEKYTDGQATVTYRAATDKLFAARSQYTNAVQALYPDNDSPDKAHRDYVRFLPVGGADDIFIVRTDLKTKPASVLGGGTPLGQISTFTHYGNNGETATEIQFVNEGSTTCAGVTCSAGAVITGPLYSTNSTTNFRVISNTVYPVSSRRGLRKTELANGAYTGGRGRTFRVETCSTTDDATCSAARELTSIEVHKLTTSADATTLTLTSFNVGDWDGVQVTGTSSTRVAMFAATAQTSMGAITTTATANIAAMGLAPGTYDLRRNGTVVCNDQVIATNGVLFCESVSSGSIDIVLDGAPPAAVDITTTSPLPGGTVGVSYSQSLAATGGVPPFTWSVQSGTLCTGLTLSSAGVVSGTPTTAQTCTFTPQATDTLSSTDASPPSLQITIASGVGPVTVTTTSLPGGTRGVAYSQTLAATGGTAPYTWSVVSGALCTGLSLSSGGVLSGTPSLAQTCSFTVRATDSVSATDDQALSIVVAAAAFNWYVSASVATGGAGTIGDPWNFTEVLESPSASIQPGDTVYLRAGTYVIGRYGPLDTPWRDAVIAGASGSPVTIRPYTGETVYIDGGIHFNGGYVVFRDFIVYCSYNTRISAQSGSFPTDMPLPDMGAYAPGIQMINNIIYGLGNGIALWESAPNSLAYGNIILYPGHQGTDRGHGHGFYIQNDTGQHVVENNIVGQTFGMGGQVYGSVAASLNNVKIRKGVFYGGGSMVNNPSRNLLIGGPTGVVATDMELVDSISYGPTTLAGGTNGPEVNLGYWGSPGGGCSNMLVTGLIAITEVAPAISISDGTAAGALCNFNGSTGGNTIYGTNRGLTLPGANTLVNSASRPTTAVVRVFPNTYETGRAHIHVVNWPRNNTVSVDLSSTGLVSGDFFTIRDAQDPLGSPVLVGTYTGSPVTLPMTGTSVLTMAGVTVPFAPVHTDREFGVFLLQKSATPPAAFKSYLRGVMVIRGNTVLR